MRRWQVNQGVLLLVAVMATLLLLAACTKAANTAPESEKKQAAENSKAQNKTTEPAAQPDAKPEPPRRGCPSCHVKTAERDVSLLYEGVVRAKARGGTHPTTAADGKKMDENTTVETCLQCHAPGANGKGKAAPYALRTIVHPAHMGSESFTTKYKGNCFTCHDVDGTGTFTLLSQKVDVNEKGVPAKVPIPGMIPPSETPVKPVK